MPVPPVSVSRAEVFSTDRTRISVLVASPPPGMPPAAGLPPILAVHGFASSAQSGWGRTGHLAALTAAGRVVIAPDLRGHGRSDKPHRAGDYTLDAVLADLTEVVRALAGPAAPGSPGPEAGAAPAAMPAASGSAAMPAASYSSGELDLLGYSLGARLCWTLARDGLLPVRRMVLGGFDGRPLFQGIDAERLDRLAAGVPSNDREALRCLVAGLAGTGGAAPDRRPPDVPTLLVAGDADPLATRARHFAAHLPRGSFLQVPGRNHISAVPASAFRTAVREFLGVTGVGAGPDGTDDPDATAGEGALSGGAR